MKNKKYISGSVLVLAIIAIVAGIFYVQENNKVQIVSRDDPTDIVVDFYQTWLDTVQSTSTDPYQAGLTDNTLLSKALQKKLSQAHEASDVDPVLCQIPTPRRFKVETAYEQPDEIQMNVFSKGSETVSQSVVTIRQLDEGWYIDDISCINESDPNTDREFTFEHEGVLSKDPAFVTDAAYWHIIYIQNIVPDRVVPLFFDTESTCIDQDKKESTCDQNQFTEMQHVIVRGNMTEAGLEVQQVETL